MKNLIYVFGLALSFLAGCIANDQIDMSAQASGEPQRPAYMIISINEIEPEKLGPFKEAVRPIVQKAGGAELLAVSQQSDVQVLEGDWDFPGLLLIERFKSMDALKSYWYSDEYKEVKKLREGYAEANFFVALEGRPLSQ